MGAFDKQRTQMGSLTVTGVIQRDTPAEGIAYRDIIANAEDAQGLAERRR